MGVTFYVDDADADNVCSGVNGSIMEDATSDRAGKDSRIDEVDSEKIASEEIGGKSVSGGKRIDIAASEASQELDRDDIASENMGNIGGTNDVAGSDGMENENASVTTGQDGARVVPTSDRAGNENADKLVKVAGPTEDLIIDGAMEDLMIDGATKEEGDGEG